MPEPKYKLQRDARVLSAIVILIGVVVFVIHLAELTLSVPGLVIFIFGLICFAASKFIR